jgi:hypothetical protein
MILFSGIRNSIDPSEGGMIGEPLSTRPSCATVCRGRYSRNFLRPHGSALLNCLFVERGSRTLCSPRRCFLCDRRDANVPGRFHVAIFRWGVRPVYFRSARSAQYYCASGRNAGHAASEGARFPGFNWAVGWFVPWRRLVAVATRPPRSGHYFRICRNHTLPKYPAGGE